MPADGTHSTGVKLSNISDIKLPLRGPLCQLLKNTQRPGFKAAEWPRDGSIVPSNRFQPTFIFLLLKLNSFIFMSHFKSTALDPVLDKTQSFWGLQLWGSHSIQETLVELSESNLTYQKVDLSADKE